MKLSHLLVFLVAGCNCSDTLDLPDADTGPDGSRRDGSSEGTDAEAAGRDGTVDAPSGMTITEDGGFTWTCVVTECGGHLLECGNCEDDDGDGLVDSRDPECLGPCDNTEGPGLNAGIGGESGGPCKADCYFDFGNGSGNDDCFWDHRCDPLAVAPDYPPEGDRCAFEESRVGSRDCPATQSDQCHEVCSPLTPNGCDCFGCCTFDELDGTGPGGADEFVWIGALGSDGEGTCTFDALGDPAACPPCTPVGDCFNDCGTCELCVGRDTLPPECSPPDGGVDVDAGMPGARCPAGVPVCGLPGEAACAAGFYCVTGCCRPTLI